MNCCITETYTLTQCAAVSTTWRWMREPPHRYSKPKLISEGRRSTPTIQGNSAYPAKVMSMISAELLFLRFPHIRLVGAEDWGGTVVMSSRLQLVSKLSHFCSKVLTNSAQLNPLLKIYCKKWRKEQGYSKL